MTILTAEKFEFLSIDRSSHGKAVRNPLNLMQLAENLEGANLKSCLSCRSCSEERLSPHFAHEVWICILRYTELYSYFITFVWFLMCENVNCVLIDSPLNATLYYVLPHRKFPEEFGAQSF